MRNIKSKAEYLAMYVRGNNLADFGSEDVNWGENLHDHLEECVGRKILRVDKFGDPDRKVDFNEEILPFHNEAFDTIICSEVIEHLENPHQFLKQCHRVLKKGGKLILTTPNACGLPELFRLYSEHSKGYPTHLYAWNWINMRDLAEYVGFEIDYFEYLSYYWNRNLLFRAIAFLIPRLSPELMFVLKKKSESS